MINGYTEGYGYTESLRKGAVDVWIDDGDLKRGLIFGMPDVIADQQCSSTAVGRSLNVALKHGRPVLAWTPPPVAC